MDHEEDELEEKDLFLGDDEDENDKEEDPLSMGGFHEIDADGFALESEI